MHTVPCIRGCGWYLVGSSTLFDHLAYIYKAVYGKLFYLLCEASPLECHSVPAVLSMPANLNQLALLMNIAFAEFLHQNFKNIPGFTYTRIA